MFGPISKSSQSIHSNNRTRTFREASKRVEKQKLSRALRYKQSATTLKSKESSVVADRVRSPSLVTLPGEPKDGRLVSPLLEKQTGATGNELGTSSARLGEVRDPSGEEDKNDDKVRQQSRGNDNQAPMEHPARRDFRLRAQRIAKLCPSLVRNRTEMHRGPTFSEAWEDLETSISKAETAKGVFWHQETRTAYCFVPKAGCTFWIRIFSFLQASYTGVFLLDLFLLLPIDAYTGVFLLDLLLLLPLDALQLLILFTHIYVFAISGLGFCVLCILFFF